MVEFTDELTIWITIPLEGTRTLATLIRGMNVRDRLYEWQTIDYHTATGTCKGRYTFHTDKEGRWLNVPEFLEKTFMFVQGVERGDGTIRVGLKFLSESLWKLGVYHVLLDNIITVWPETRGSIDRQLDIDLDDDVENIPSRKVVRPGDKAREVALILKAIKDRHPDLTYEGVATWANRAIDEKTSTGQQLLKLEYGNITPKIVEHSYWKMGWKWERGARTR